MLNQLTAKLGFVVIGRNEGARLERCLESIMQRGERVVYVDSGSHDDSVIVAKHHGAVVLELTADAPFTAARARNEGFDRLLQQWPDTEFVMFIDGDCELISGFVEAAIENLTSQPILGVVTGHCKERRPEETIYNRVCDMEWAGPVGEIDACGGIFVIRSATFGSINGFNASLIAGEEPELCIRIRAKGERIFRVENDMCFHDADMRHFSQWWRRAIRGGHSYAQVSQIHPGAYAAERRRAWMWGAILPLVILTAAPFTNGWSAALLLLYIVSFLKTWRGLIGVGAASNHAALYALFLVISKFPNLLGMLDYRRKRIFKKPIALIEYK